MRGDDAIDAAFVERLRTSIGGESLRSFSEKARVSYSALGSYLRGSSDPTRRVLIAIADAANVNVEWLATGAGTMRSAATTKVDRELLQDLLRGYAQLVNPSATEAEGMSQWVALRYALIIDGAVTPEARTSMLRMALAELTLVLKERN